MINGYQALVLHEGHSDRFPHFGLELVPDLDVTVSKLQDLILEQLHGLLAEYGFVSLRGVQIEEGVYGALGLSNTKMQQFHYDRPVRGTNRFVTTLYYPRQDIPRLTATVLEDRQVAIAVLERLLDTAIPAHRDLLMANLDALPIIPLRNKDTSFADYIVNNNLLKCLPEDLYLQFEQSLLQTAHHHQYNQKYDTALIFDNSALIHTRWYAGSDVPKEQGRLQVLKGTAITDRNAFTLAL